MRLFEKYAKGDFKDYEDFKQNFRIDVPEKFNFGFDVVDVLADTKPDKPALMWTNVDGEEHLFTFSDMKKMSNKTANYLKRQGIKKGDKVLLILKRHYEFWFTMIALCKLGAVAVPATHLLMKKDIVYRTNMAEIKMVICTNEGTVKQEVEAAMSESPTVEKLVILNENRPGWDCFNTGIEAESDVLPREIVNTNEDMMLLYFTSGTSGMPKMVAHDFKYPLGHIVTAVFWHNADPEGMHLTVAESGWAKCVWGKLYGQWLAETCIFVYDFEKFDPPAMLSIIEKYKITTFCAPPTIYRFFIKEDLSKYDLSSLKYTTIAGEPLNPEVFEQWKKATGLNLMEIFGQTETGVTVGNFIFMQPKPGSMGKPNPLYNMDIINDKGESCGPGEVGEIIIKTHNGTPVGMFMGYYKDNSRTESVWKDGIYRTGDTAWRDEMGYYWYVGRADDVIKSSGYRIGPFEVESALMEHPAVLETAITGVPHPIRGQIVKATIVLAKGYEPSEELKKELQDFVKRTTAPYKYPREIEFVTELPKTISGKIRRVEIRENDNK